MFLSAERTNGNTIDNPLFVEDIESPPASNPKTPEESESTMAERDKKEGKSEKNVVKLHHSDTMKHESSTMKKIEHGVELVFKNDKYTTPVTYEFASERKPIKSTYLKVTKRFSPQRKLWITPPRSPLTKEKYLYILTPFQRNKTTRSISPFVMEYKNRETFYMLSNGIIY